jgi:hypothetical protein
LSLTSIQKTEQLLLFYLVLCATSSASCDLPVPPGPTIASVVVVCSLVKSFASSSASCDLRPTKQEFCEKGMINGVLLAPSSSAYSLFRALSCSSPYAVGIETPRILSRQYTMSSSSVVMRLSAYFFRSDILNLCRGQLRNAASGMLVISWISWLSNAFSPIGCPPRKKNSTDTGAISSWSVHPRVNYALARNNASQSLR